MISKTPQFDKALDEYFSKLVLDEKGGQWRVCRFSGAKFYVRPEDIEFYKKIRVPLPILCPNERMRRKIAFDNAHNLYYISSALTDKKILSNYPPDSGYKIYEHQTWFGGEWDATEFSINYVSDNNFFTQFRELASRVPRPSLIVDNTSENSEYSNEAYHLKNCYLVFSALDSEDSAYSIDLRQSKNCFDCFTLINSQYCYQCYVSTSLYECFFVEFSRDCLNSYFLYDCRDCSHCFGGTNLRHKKYVFFNEQLTKEEYERKIEKINLGDRGELNSYLSKFAELKNDAIHKPDHNERAINCTGDFIIRSKDVFNSYFIYDSERSAYSIGALNIRDSYDLMALDSEFSYDSSGSNSYHMRFCCEAWYSRDIEYSNFCINCHDCFGCIGLTNKSFCIFNKQYSEKNYWELVDQIKIKMFQDGEYGEFFPPELSFFPYNISLAACYKGFDDFNQARQYGYILKNISEIQFVSEGDMIQVENLPHDIKDVDYGILDKIISDNKNNKKFKYIKAEIDFYKKYNFPLPLEHYQVRLAEKRIKLGPIVVNIFERNCPKCGKKFETVYKPEDQRIVYCEPCYLKEIV